LHVFHTVVAIRAYAARETVVNYLKEVNMLISILVNVIEAVVGKLLVGLVLTVLL